MIKTTEIAWLGGLLEGEGWFGFKNKKCVRLSLQMTDEDTVIRAAAIWKSGVWKERNTWITGVSGVRAIQWMMTLLPFFGSRRRSRVAYIVQYWKEHTSVIGFGRTMAKCHPDKVMRAFGLCKSCYDRQRRKKQLLKRTG